MEEKDLLPFIHERIEKIRDELIANLRRRKVVGQFALVTSITAKVSGATIAETNVEFVFNLATRTKTERSEENGFRVFDPLFKRMQPYSRESQRIAFVRNANIYKNLEDKYFDRLVEEIAGVNAEIAAKLSIRPLVQQ